MNKTRSNVINEFNHIFNIIISNKIELSLYDHTVNYCKKRNIECSWLILIFKHIYILKTNQTLYRLRGSKSIQDDINNKVIDPSTIVGVHFEEFYPNMNKQYEVEETITQEDGMFKCRKCNSMKTTYYSLQTRSSDEPMTCFVTCTDCKNRWKC